MLRSFWTLVFLIPLAIAVCPPTATEAYNQCYVPSRMLATWPSAEAICQNMGGHLASVKDAEQNAFIQKLLNDQMISNAWIGANAAGLSWSNSDGSAYSYTNFKATPNVNYVNSGALMDVFGGGQWTQKVSSMSYRFVCQFPACSSDGTLQQSLLPKTNGSGLLFSEMTNSFYFTSAYEKVQISVAEKECAAVGGHLPSISNAFENSELLNIIDALDNFGYDNNYALGLFSDSKGKWQWSDGKTAGYTNWDPKINPSGANLKSVFSKNKGLWLTSSDVQNTFICQFSLNNRKFC